MKGIADARWSKSPPTRQCHAAFGVPQRSSLIGYACRLFFFCFNPSLFHIAGIPIEAGDWNGLLKPGFQDATPRYFEG
jgi:hypothetical protein